MSLLPALPAAVYVVASLTLAALVMLWLAWGIAHRH